MDIDMTSLDFHIRMGMDGREISKQRGNCSASRKLVTLNTTIAEQKAINLHRAITDNGFTNRAVVYYQMRMAGFNVKGL